MQRFSSSLLLVVILLTFVGEAVASVSLECDMPHMTNSASHTQQHAMQSEHTHTDIMQMDCCDEQPSNNDCHCPINGCGGSSILDFYAVFDAFALPTEKVSQLNFEMSLPPTSTLFRPPMFA